MSTSLSCIGYPPCTELGAGLGDAPLLTDTGKNNLPHPLDAGGIKTVNSKHSSFLFLRFVKIVKYFEILVFFLNKYRYKSCTYVDYEI